MSEQNDDNLMQAASRLATEIAPERDLWPGIAEAIEQPPTRRWSPMLAQAAGVLMLMAASAGVTWYLMQGEDGARTEVVNPDVMFERASFGSRSLGPGFQDARDSLVAELNVELEKLSDEDRATISTNLTVIHSAINEMNEALEEEPDNVFLQERLLRTYREELVLLRRVGGLTRNVMLRNDI